MDVLQIINEVFIDTMHITYHTLIGYRIYVQSRFFPDRPRMSISYSEAGARTDVNRFRTTATTPAARALEQAAV